MDLKTIEHISPELEAEWASARLLSQRLHFPLLEPYWTLEVTKDGRQLEYKHFRAHTYVRNAYNYWLVHGAAVNADDVTFAAGVISFKNTASTILHTSSPDVAIPYNTNVEAPANNRGFTAAAGIDTSGILVGTGTTAESFEDVALATPVASGNGAGQLSYSVHTAPAISYDGGLKKWTIDHVRYFNNNSGGSIGVNELALVMGTISNFVGGLANVLMDRTKLGSTTTVVDTAQLKVTYTITLTFP